MPTPPIGRIALLVDFHAPEFERGRKVEPARIDVRQNGVEIHQNVPIPIDNTVAGLGGNPRQPGPNMHQDHGNPVRFRGVWPVPLDPKLSS